MPVLFLAYSCSYPLDLVQPSVKGAVVSTTLLSICCRAYLDKHKQSGKSTRSVGQHSALHHFADPTRANRYTISSFGVLLETFVKSLVLFITCPPAWFSVCKTESNLMIRDNCATPPMRACFCFRPPLLWLVTFTPVCFWEA